MSDDRLSNYCINNIYIIFTRFHICGFAYPGSSDDEVAESLGIESVNESMRMTSIITTTLS